MISSLFLYSNPGLKGSVLDSMFSNSGKVQILSAFSSMNTLFSFLEFKKDSTKVLKDYFLIKHTL